MATQAIPEGFSSLTPYLIVKGAARAIDFYREAFGATELFRMDMPGGRIGHAELQFGNVRVMLADEEPGMCALSPATLGGAGISLMLYVEDVDQAYPRAIAAGAVELRPLQDQFYGDRSGTVRDPFGHVWTLGTHVEDVPPEELRRRLDAMLSAPAG